MMRAGFASTSITPPPGREIPGLFERRIAEGVHDDLFARAAVLDDGLRTVALVQVDAIKVSEDVVAEARSEASRFCGIPKDACFIAATHTHSGGPCFAGFAAEADASYQAYVVQQIAFSIAEAHRRLRPVLPGAGAALAEGVAFNRRFIMNDGRQMTHPGKMNPGIAEPAGPADPTVTVVGFANPADLRPVGCIVTFACHATHMNGYLYSADYPKFIVDTLRAVHGPDFGVVFLNGACGDVTQVDNRSPRPGEFGLYWCERTGRTVGAAALQAMARMDFLREATIDARAARIRAAIRTPAPAALKAARELLKRKKVTHTDVETIYASELFEVEKMRRQTPNRTLEVMAVRIADAVLWGVPGEYFQSFARQVREASPFAHTCCIELANGYNGYICTPEAFGGGYEPRTARSSFLEPAAGNRIASAAKRLCASLHASAADEIQALPDRRVWTSTGDDALDGIKQLKKRR